MTSHFLPQENIQKKKAKEVFCEIIGIKAEERFAKGEDVLNLIE